MKYDLRLNLNNGESHLLLQPTGDDGPDHQFAVYVDAVTGKRVFAGYIQVSQLYWLMDELAGWCPREALTHMGPEAPERIN